MGNGFLYINKTENQPAVLEAIVRAIVNVDSLRGNYNSRVDGPAKLFHRWIQRFQFSNVLMQPFDFAVFCLEQKDVHLDLEEISAYLSSILALIPKKTEARELVQALLEVVDHLATAYQYESVDGDLRWFKGEVVDKVMNAGDSGDSGDYGEYAQRLNGFFIGDNKKIFFFIDFIQDNPDYAVKFFKILKDEVPSLVFDQNESICRRLAEEYVIYFGRLASAYLRYSLGLSIKPGSPDLNDEYFVTAGKSAAPAASPTPAADMPADETPAAGTLPDCKDLYALINKSNNAIGPLEQGTPSYLLQKWLEQAGADSDPLDFLVLCWNQSEVPLEDIIAHLESITSSISDSKDANEDQARLLVEGLVQILKYLEYSNNLENDEDDDLKWFKEQVIDAVMELDDCPEFVQTLKSFFTGNKNTRVSLIDFIKESPETAVEFFLILQDKVKDVMDPVFDAGLAEEAEGCISSFALLASAQLRYSTKEKQVQDISFSDKDPEAQQPPDESNNSLAGVDASITQAKPDQEVQLQQPEYANKDNISTSPAGTEKTQTSKKDNLAQGKIPAPKEVQLEPPEYANKDNRSTIPAGTETTQTSKKDNLAQGKIPAPADHKTVSYYAGPPIGASVNSAVKPAQNNKRFAPYAYVFSGFTVTALLIYYRSHVLNAMIAVMNSHVLNAMIAVMKPIVAFVLAHKLLCASGLVAVVLSARYLYNNYWKENSKKESVDAIKETQEAQGLTFQSSS